MSNTIIRRKLRVLAGCLLIILVGILAGCSEPADTDTNTEAVTKSECSSYTPDFETCTVTMPDTRRVTCIISGHAMSCDWIHADGSDYMGAES
ncbi:hypothetical protein [Bifidobacterium myosotis]|uniref:DUF333 domain-containing protein n=1 Tax=Bifidobacterium myosotis TaxID=1630166 RepID=A0A5M9ZHW7_9BIFI|nr:hypothetical protein [Bifidobacterium myosotis]KAA8827207.1 hypothetical protein EMO91_09140 [Bifidobacterium myosotis]